jgi:hypothetical protein
LYIYNLISINLHRSSKCKVPSSFKDFVDTATTASGAGAAAFTEFLALALFVLCLTVIMSLVEEYKSLFSQPEEDLMGALHFNGAFMILYLYGLSPII